MLHIRMLQWAWCHRMLHIRMLQWTWCHRMLHIRMLQWAGCYSYTQSSKPASCWDIDLNLIIRCIAKRSNVALWLYVCTSDTSLLRNLVGYQILQPPSLPQSLNKIPYIKWSLKWPQNNLPKGRVAVPYGRKILAFPKKGGGLTMPRFFSEYIKKSRKSPIMVPKKSQFCHCVPGLGGGRGGSANFGNASIYRPPVTTLRLKTYV